MHTRLVALPSRQAAEHRRGGGRETNGRIAAIWHRMQPSSMTVLLSLLGVRCVRLSCGLVLIVAVARVPRSQSLDAVTHTFTPAATRDRRSRRS